MESQDEDTDDTGDIPGSRMVEDITKYDISPEKDDDDIELDHKIWKLIGHKSYLDRCSVLSTLKILPCLYHTLSKDDIYQNAMKRIDTVRDECNMGFKEALDYLLDERKDCIFNRIKQSEIEMETKAKRMKVVQRKILKLKVSVMIKV